MAAYYTYLISSLPMLHFGMRPPFSWEKFISICSEFIPEEDSRILNSIPQIQVGLYQGRHPTLMKWQGFEIALRNELVKIRSSLKHIDPLKFMRQTNYSDFSLVHIAMNAHRNPSILEGEKTLDQQRWHFLESLTFGHYFDLDALIVYALKLLILGCWEKINTADKPKILEEILVKA